MTGASEKDVNSRSAIGGGTAIRISLVLSVASILLAQLLWLTSALGGIREQIRDVASGTRGNSQQIAALKELVTVQLQVASDDASELRADMKDLERRVRSLENGGR